MISNSKEDELVSISISDNSRKKQITPSSSTELKTNKGNDGGGKKNKNAVVHERRLHQKQKEID